MDDVYELEDVNRRPGSQEHHTQTNRHLEESVEFPILGPPETALFRSDRTSRTGVVCLCVGLLS